MTISKSQGLHNPYADDGFKDHTYVAAIPLNVSYYELVRGRVTLQISCSHIPFFVSLPYVAASRNQMSAALERGLSALCRLTVLLIFTALLLQHDTDQHRTSPIMRFTSYMRNLASRIRNQ